MIKLNNCTPLLFFHIIYIAAAAILCSITATHAQSPLMTAGEQDALYETMNAMAGYVDWKQVHPRPCSDDLWPGLVCEPGEDGLLHVTRLDFGYRPNPECTSNATIPRAIMKLSYLRSLFIFECFSTMKTTIPTSLVKLAPTLQELSLRTNSALVGGIPMELSNLSSLQLLSLSQNSLQGAIPLQFSKLKNLQHLDLSDNLLSGELPPELGNLHNLVILDLSANSITGPIPSLLGNLTNLQKLDLSSNSLSGALPTQLGNLRKLQFLALNDNSLSGPYPPEMVKLNALQYFIMENNPMNTTLPSFIGTYRSLMALSLSNSQFYGPIPDEYGKLGNLTVLSLDRNNLTGSIPEGLGDLVHIYQLNLSKNNLSGAVPFTPEFVQKLGRNLDISENKGLCSHWSLPQMIGFSGGIGSCPSPKPSSFSASSIQISSFSATSFCILYIGIFFSL